MSDQVATSHLALLRERVPELAVVELRPLQHHGWGGDCDVYLADGRWVFRFPRTEDVARALEVEARLLPAIAERVPIAVPHYEHVGRDPASGLPLFGGYRMLPGEPLPGSAIRRLAAADPAVLDGLAAELGGFLAGLHSTPVELAVAASLEAPRLSIREGVERQRARIRAEVFPALDAEEASGLDRLLEAYLDDPAHFAWDQVVCHGDFSSDHIIVEGERPERLSGVIDFGDLRIGDPAGEFTWRAEYGDEFFWLALGSYRPKPADPAAFARAVEYRWRLIPTIEIAYGLETGNAECVAEGRRDLRARLLGE